MFPPVDTKSPAATGAEVGSIYLAMFPSGNRQFVENAFKWATDCFTGRYSDYLPIDARYHDFEHTLQGTLCLARLLHGYHHAGEKPELTQRKFELGLLAILLHDTGYLKHHDDQEGTGAKYTMTHVVRSVEFAGQLLREKGYSMEDIQTVQNMIRCTGVNVDLTRIPFRTDLERKVAYALGTADLLGQMAADDYIDKLGILYTEFEEAAQYSGKGANAGPFTSEEDLKRKTPVFWEKYVIPKINGDFQGLHRFLGRPEPQEDHLYLEKIRANLSRLQESLQAAA
ncbi:MAG: HD domain-containing protein [Verrucomicrobiota bacterium]|nr:HD domain-containing protein [Verrucomicrobiota bacterium]